MVVAGGGIVAWSAAAALKRQIPFLEISVAACPVPEDALADRMIATLPSIVGFHEDLGLSETDTILGAQSGLRIGTLFEGWSNGLPSYVHAYGSYGSAVDGIPFHQLWLRAREKDGVAPFDRFSAGAELGRLGRIGCGINPAAPEIGYGLHLTLEQYQILIRDYALHLGAREWSCRSLEPKLREDRFVDSLILDGERILAGDLFVDCAGPAAPIRAALDDHFEDWSAWVPCDRLIFAAVGPADGAQLLDRTTACANGWRWQASSPSRSSLGLAFSSSHPGVDDAFRSFLGTAEDPIEIRLRPGRFHNPWVRNCVAIGDAAARMEPLEWANLHLAHSQIDRLIAMIPGPDCAAIELNEYNRQCGVEADRVRDFICMHYVTARRHEPFWQDVATMEPPPSLAHTLAQFAQRGRLPYYEEETFSRDSWAAVLLGQGLEPRGTDPLADSLPLDRIKLELGRSADSIRSFVAAQPLYVDHMSKLSRQTV